MSNRKYENYINMCDLIRIKLERNERFMSYVHSDGKNKPNGDEISKKIYEASLSLYKAVCTISKSKKVNGRYPDVVFTDETKKFLSDNADIMNQYQEYMKQNPSLVAKENEAGNDIRMCFDLLLDAGAAKNLIIDMEDVNTRFFNALDSEDLTKGDRSYYNTVFSKVSSSLINSQNYKIYSDVLKAYNGSYDEAEKMLSQKCRELKDKLASLNKTTTNNNINLIKATEEIAQYQNAYSENLIRLHAIEADINSVTQDSIKNNSEHRDFVEQYNSTIKSHNERLKLAVDQVTRYQQEYGTANANIDPGFEELYNQINTLTNTVNEYSTFEKYYENLSPLRGDDLHDNDLAFKKNIDDFYLLRRASLHPELLEGKHPASMEELVKCKEIQMILDIEQKYNIANNPNENSAYYNFDELLNTLNNDLTANKDQHEQDAKSLISLNEMMNKNFSKDVQKTNIDNIIIRNQIGPNLSYFNNIVTQCTADITEYNKKATEIDNQYKANSTSLAEKLSKLKNDMDACQKAVTKSLSAKITALSKKELLENSIDKNNKQAEPLQKEYQTAFATHQVIVEVRKELSDAVLTQQNFISKLKTHNANLQNITAKTFAYTNKDDILNRIKFIKDNINANDKLIHTNSGAFTQMMTSLDNLANAYNTNTGIEEALSDCYKYANDYITAKRGQWVEHLGKHMASDQRTTRLHYANMITSLCENQNLINSYAPRSNSVSRLLNTVDENNKLIEAFDKRGEITPEKINDDMIQIVYNPHDKKLDGKAEDKVEDLNKLIELKTM